MPFREIPKGIQGVGLGLRQSHFSEILETRPNISWFEVLADNYMESEDPLWPKLELIRSHYPMVLHCVGMNLGSVDPLDKKYLKKLKELMLRLEPTWISDHLCWTAVQGRYHHDLLPLPYNEEVAKYVSLRIQKIQEILGGQILIENVSSYIEYQISEMTEWEFLSEVVKNSGCGILLDINNIYVNSVNHRFSVDEYLQGLSEDCVVQFHLAGYEKQNDTLIDTHGASISNDVWKLYGQALKRFGPVPTSIERDNHIPELQTLIDETNEAKRWMNSPF